MLARSREVKDLLVLLRWLVYPTDETALASVLRSPIFRVNEATLQDALARRAVESASGESSLWSVLMRHGEELGLGEAAALLRQWRRRVGYESCHDLLRRIFRTGHLLERYEVALGEQARFNLLRLHDLSLSPELGAFPTVRQLADLIQRAAETPTEEEATLPEEGRGRVRLMTVHGAKGLEAPVVLLVDADATGREEIDRLSLAPDSSRSTLLYGLRRDHLRAPGPGAVGPLGQAAARARARALREETNILYVAMTRARDSLFVLGAESARKGDGKSFLDRLREAAAADRERTPDPAGPPPYATEAPLWLAAEPAAGPVPDRAGRPGAAIDSGEGEAPEFQVWTPPPQRPALEIVTPSREDADPESGYLEPAAAESDLARSEALARGEAIHLWLEEAVTGQEPPVTDSAHREASEVFSNPDLAWIFHPENESGRGLAEVPVIVRLGSPGTGEPAPERRALGVIDRLVLRPGRADVIDFKSHPTSGREEEVAALADRFRSQLLVYREAVAALFPDREVGCHLLFTFPRTERGRGLLVTLDP